MPRTILLRQQQKKTKQKMRMRQKKGLKTRAADDFDLHKGPAQGLIGQAL